MNIWIDLSNSPHVLFFNPIINKLEEQGHNIIVSHRDFAQTSRLCKIYGISSTLIGIHGGQGVLRKIRNISGRAMQLRAFAKKHGKIDMAVSHNSYSHCIAAKSLGIPYITIMDYEYQPANHINFRLADKILVPFTFKIEEIRKYGAAEKRLEKYPGLKEDIYLWEFRHDSGFWQKEFPELDPGKVMCTVRPPATMAAYHNFENPIFYDLLKFLLLNNDVHVVLFPRTQAQRDQLKQKFPNLFMPSKSVNGAQLISNSDLIISAGGTMNREAAVLGTPVYTIYAGKMGSVDKYLIKKGKIQLLHKKSEFKTIVLKKKQKKEVIVDRKVFDFVISILTSAL